MITQGDWKVEGDELNGRFGFTVVAKNGQIASVDAKASVYAGHGKEKDLRSRTPLGQREAWDNAHIIAKAPAMARTLIQMADRYDDGDESAVLDIFVSILPDIEALRARVEGDGPLEIGAP